jgi:hypothetical protein
MEQNKLKVYLFEGTRNKKNEDGTVSAERETFFQSYAFEGDPKPRVDYNRYWEFGDGCLNLVAEDGREISGDVSSTIEWAYDSGFRGVDIGKMVYGLDAPGKWTEVCLGDEFATTLRVTMLGDLPKVDRERTVRNSDLAPMQQHRVLVDGVPLFPEGGAIESGNPKVPTFVLRPELAKELDKMWETHIHRETRAVSVKVKVDTSYHSADSIDRKLTIEANTRSELDAALATIGVLKPEAIVPDFVSGEGDEPRRYVATVVLSTEV